MLREGGVRRGFQGLVGGHYARHRSLEGLVLEQTIWEGEELASSERKEEEKEGWPTRIWEMTLA